jgi:D-glycero-alpha-D-manno-heptose-7-phosphate kinase
MRISLIGGGSDYPEVFNDSGGFSVGCAINWNVFVTVNALHSSSDENFRIGYRKTESVKTKLEIEHPTVRVLLEELDWDVPVSINTYADVPARSGLGGSSAFTSALIKALYAFKSEEISLNELVNLSIRVERVLANEPGGHQDQYMTSFGGFRSYDFTRYGVTVSDQLVSEEIEKAIGSALFLTPIKVSRNANYAKYTADSITQNLHSRKAAVESARWARDFAEFLSTEKNLKNIIQKFGEILNLSHELKSQFSVFPDEANYLIGELNSIGAVGSKLCGAGGGGFIASIVPEHSREYFSRLSAKFGSTSPGISKNGTQLADFRWR